MRRRLLIAAAGAVAALLAIALLLYLNPFENMFNKLFGVTEYKDPEAFSAEFTSFYDDEAPALPEKVEQLIQGYFSAFYEAVGANGGLREIERLYYADNTDYLTDSLAVKAAGIFEYAGKNDLSFNKCAVKLRYHSGSVEDTGIAALTLSQSVKVYYDFFPEGGCSEVGVIYHTFVLKLSGGNWKIYNHTADGGLWEYARRQLELQYAPQGYSYTDISYSKMLKYHDAALEQVQEDSSGVAEKIYSSSGVPLSSTDNPYDRQAAVSYAMKWAAGDRELRNLEGYISYENDSANFTSQCILAAGIPMDISGEELWKWYGENRDFTNEPVGCSKSWYDPTAFSKYCENNMSGGICAVPDIAGQLLDKGDIVQFYRKNPLTGELSVSWQGIITGIVKDKDGVRDYLITSHSPELLNMPLSGITEDGVGFIKIIGSDDS